MKKKPKKRYGVRYGNERTDYALSGADKRGERCTGDNAAGVGKGRRATPAPDNAISFYGQRACP